MISKRFISVAAAFVINILAAFVYDRISHFDSGRVGIWTVFSVVTLAQVSLLCLAIWWTEEKARKARANRSQILHRYVHAARDLGVKLLRVNRERLPDPAFLRDHSDIGKMLDEVQHLFQALAPSNTNVWVALRVRREDDKFHTIRRTAGCHPNRSRDTEPLSRDSKIIKTLEDTFNAKGNADCVILTGSGRPEWQPLKSDHYGETKGVLLGAIFSKSWNEPEQEFDDVLLTSILCVNADKEGAFNESHKPLMRCCNDVLSWLLNQLVRPPKPGPELPGALR